MSKFCLSYFATTPYVFVPLSIHISLLVAMLTMISDFYRLSHTEVNWFANNCFVWVMQPPATALIEE